MKKQIKIKTTEKTETTKTWFEKTLPTAIRKIAIENTPKSALKSRHATFKKALFNAFQWDNTKQGFEYWKQLFDNDGKQN